MGQLWVTLGAADPLTVQGYLEELVVRRSSRRQ